MELCNLIFLSITADCPKKSYCNLANVADMFENWDEIPPNYCKTGEEQKEKEGSKCTDNDNCENDLICMSEGIGTWHTDKNGEQTYTDENGEVQKWEEICKHPGKTGETCMADEGESSCETGLMCTPKKIPVAGKLVEIKTKRGEWTGLCAER